MFARRSDASKVALVSLACQLRAWGFRLIDCQMSTPHLASLGARDVPRARFLAEVADLMRSGRCVAVLAGDEFVPVAVVSSLLQVPHDQARRLLVRGVIPCQVIARRRHALVSDVLAYRDQLRRAREVALDQLVEEAQLLGLGY